MGPHPANSEFAETDTGVHVIEGSNHDCTIVAFTGLRARSDNPLFEFLTTLGPFDYRRVLVRDPRQRFYHRRVPGLGRTIPQAARRIERLSEGRPILMLGVSAGGYAALLFGALVGAEVVIAFAPTSTVDIDQRLALGDIRNRRAIRNVSRGPRAQPEYLDLVSVLESRRITGDYSLYFGEDHEVDRSHAERLGATGTVQLHPCAGADHNLVRTLRDSDRLTPILHEGVANTIARRTEQRSGLQLRSGHPS